MVTARCMVLAWELDRLSRRFPISNSSQMKNGPELFMNRDIFLVLDYTASFDIIILPCIKVGKENLFE